LRQLPRGEEGLRPLPLLPGVALSQLVHLAHEGGVGGGIGHKEAHDLAGRAVGKTGAGPYHRLLNLRAQVAFWLHFKQLVQEEAVPSFPVAVVAAAEGDLPQKGKYGGQKNYTAVRRYVGYFRYDTEEQLLLLNQLYEVLCLYLNFFQPQARLKEKVREGPKVKKRYDEPKTPYRRLLESPEVDEVTKRKLRRKYKKLNPAQLMREINAIQRKLFKIARFGASDQAEEAEQEAISLE